MFAYIFAYLMLLKAEQETLVKELQNGKSKEHSNQSTAIAAEVKGLFGNIHKYNTQE